MAPTREQIESGNFDMLKLIQENKDTHYSELPLGRPRLESNSTKPVYSRWDQFWKVCKKHPLFMIGKHF